MPSRAGDGPNDTLGGARSGASACASSLARPRARFDLAEVARSGASAFALAVALLGSGCQLIGYDLVGRRDDAGGLTTVQSDAEISVGPDAHNLNGSDAQTLGSADADVGSDAAGGPPDAHADSGASCSGAINACGGCSVLSSALNQSCGLCGVGHYACDGTDGLVCNGAAAAPTASGGSVMIDDFEDGDSIPKALSGTDGYWSVYSDHTGGTLNPPDGSRITPAYEGAAGTARSAHMSGGGFTAYGAGLILWPNAQQCDFDVSSEQGISFWLKGSGTVEVAIATDETADAAFCHTTCNDFYRMSYPLTGTWTHYMLPWSNLKQAGWGVPVPFVASHVQYFQFSFGAKVNFDLYLDEVSFF